MSPDELKNTLTHFGLLAAVGVLFGVGRLLSTDVRLPRRHIAGRVITSAGLGASASALLTLFPELPLAAQCGVAAAMASLGTSALTLLFQRILGGSGEGGGGE